MPKADINESLTLLTCTRSGTENNVRERATATVAPLQIAPLPRPSPPPQDQPHPRSSGKTLWYLTLVRGSAIIDATASRHLA